MNDYNWIDLIKDEQNRMTNKYFSHTDVSVYRMKILTFIELADI